MRKTISLDGTWQLWHCPDGQGAIDELQGIPWIEGAVPGCAHYDLLRQGHIEDPFFEKNTRKLYDLELHEWWYRTTFQAPEALDGERVELVFEGLDTFATAWLNGVEVGRHENMFTAVAFGVTAAIKAGAANELVVRLGSPLKAVEGRPMEGTAATMNDPERLWARKLDQCYGWDIACRIVTAGIWRPVKLVSYGRARLGDDFVRVTELVWPKDEAPGPQALGVTAKVAADVPVDVFAGGAEGLRVKVEGVCEGSSFEVEAPVVDGQANFALEIPAARLWWTWDLGTPNLYDLTLTLLDGETVVDVKRRKQGLRTVRLVEEDQGEGKVSYYFRLNDVGVFIRGMNWTPADCYHALGEGPKHEALLEMSRRMNLNMLRVWGGGVYEPDAWFAGLDELGIMVYQDFMMACALYPRHPDFLAIMADEAEAVIKQLRNYASLALWSGDNENDWGYWGWFGEPIDVRTNTITRGVLADALAKLDGTRGYVPSSPYSPDPAVHPADPFQGDNHVWHHGTAFEDPCYTEDQSRFISEIGHLSCPSLETVHSFLGPQTLWPNENTTWDHHIGCHEDLKFDPPRRKAMDDSVIAYFGEKPADLETYVVATQICQGEAYKLWTEHCRQRKAGWDCGGILLWNVADCWPQFSDAVIDYYLRPKLACNYTRWACEPVHVSFLPGADGALAIHVANDTLDAVEGAVRVVAESLGGEVLAETEKAVTVPANGAEVVADISAMAAQAREQGARLRCELRAGEKVLSANRYRFDKPTLAEIPRIVAELPAY